MVKLIPVPVLIGLSMILGVATGLVGNPVCFQIATVLSEIFMNLFKAVSLPIIFFSLVTAISGLPGMKQVRSMGVKVFSLSLLTTFLSSLVALSVYLILRPVASSVDQLENAAQVSLGAASYFSSLKKIIPYNLLVPFVEGNSLSVVVIAISFGVAALSLPNDQRKVIHQFFESFLALFMKLVSAINSILPIGVWAFSFLFARDLRNGNSLKTLFLYVCTVVLANFIQAFVVLPIFLRRSKVPLLKSVKGMWPALSLAFFSKSSSAAMPLAMSCAENNLNVQKQVSRFTYPLCTSVNMNACAGFIVITFLFIAESHGLTFSMWEFLQWALIGTVVAMGHAGVPMGCFFLASALVAQADLPITLMGVILPFYTILDMLESGINLWSDSCITLVLDKKCRD